MPNNKTGDQYAKALDGLVKTARKTIEKDTSLRKIEAAIRARDQQDTASASSRDSGDTTPDGDT